MKAIFGFFIFCLVLFLYLHIQFHLKTSDDLEMYEFDSESKDKFEEIRNFVYNEPYKWMFINVPTNRIFKEFDEIIYEDD